MPQIIADMIFLHNRGKYQTLYFTAYFSSLMVDLPLQLFVLLLTVAQIGPIIAGSMAEHHGWRSFWWFNTGLLFFTFLVNALLFPETRYKRQMPSMPQRTGAPVEEKQSHDGTASIHEAETARPALPAGFNMTGEHTWLSRGKPSKQQFKPWGSYQGNILRELWLPWYLHLFPIVEFSAFVVSFTASGFLLANLTQQQALSPPPFNFSSQSVGFTNFAILVRGLIGLFTSGPISDWVADCLTKRNNGVREPEMRLVTMVPYVFIMILGSVVVAVGYDHHWPWEAIVVVGYTCLGIQVTSLPSIASTYAIDSYKPITGSMFVTITM
jgi:MFS family permease